MLDGLQVAEVLLLRGLPVFPAHEGSQEEYVLPPSSPQDGTGTGKEKQEASVRREQPLPHGQRATSAFQLSSSFKHPRHRHRHRHRHRDKGTGTGTGTGTHHGAGLCVLPVAPLKTGSVRNEMGLQPPIQHQHQHSTGHASAAT